MANPNLKEKITLLLIIDFIYGLVGGTENQVVKLINNLDKSKYDIHLLSLRNTQWIKENISKLECKVKPYNIVK